MTVRAGAALGKALDFGRFAGKEPRNCADGQRVNHTTDRAAEASTLQPQSATPATAEQHASLRTVGRDAEGLAQVELVPGARPRPVGPGRKERAYLERIEAAERELETSRLLERGTNRLLDRLERESVEARAMERKLSFALGALQAQNRALQAQNRALLAQVEGREPGAAVAPSRLER